jgi:hypothetical protein
LRITEISESSQFSELKHTWNEVLDRSKDNNAFLTWEFQSTFWDHIKEEKKLRILLVEDQDKIIAIAPFRESHYRFRNLLSYDVLEPLTLGADYTGILLTEKKLECCSLILEHLAEKRNWDFMYFFDLPENSELLELLRQVHPNNQKFELISGKICPFISTSGSLEAFTESLDSNFRKEMKRSMRNLEKDCGEVQIKKYDELGSVEESMNIFFDLHQQRWTSREKTGVFATQKVREFFQQIAEQFAKNGWLSLYFLTIRGTPIAAQYGFEYRNKHYYVLSGFNVAYSKYGVGNLLTHKIIESCFERKIGEFDFLKGDEAYKFRWTSNYRRNFGVRITNNKFKSNIFNYGFRLIRRAQNTSSPFS